MSVLVDTNILLRSAQPSHTVHDRAVRAVSTLIEEGEALVFTPQIAAEFWNAATRPVRHNGLGLSQEEAHAELIKVEGFFSPLTESVEVYAEWKRLVLAYRVSGVQAHDARLVAAMIVYLVGRILTFNNDDFRRYTEIEIIVP